MRLYITNAQVPELASFPPEARRHLLQSAFKQMFARHPSLRWLPNGLCAVGVVIGLCTFGTFPRSSYLWGDELVRLFLPTVYILCLASAGGFIGAQILTHQSRSYLRDLISSDGLEAAFQRAVQILNERRRK